MILLFMIIFSSAHYLKATRLVIILKKVFQYTSTPSNLPAKCYLSFHELLSVSPYRYSIHLWDLNHPGTWESKGTYVYYTDFIMELAMLFLDLMHHIHMLVRQRELVM